MFPKIKYFTAFSLLFISIVSSGQENQHLVDVQSSNFLIRGKTNVNEFDCVLFQESGERKLSVKSTSSNYQLLLQGLKFKYPINDFDCGIGAMNKDLQDITNSDEHPHLFLEIHSINIDRENNQIAYLNVSSSVSITLSGVTQTYTITDGKVINRTDTELTFIGDKTLKMSDFGIDPPTKYFGLVVVTDELKVEFSIDLKVKPL